MGKSLGLSCLCPEPVCFWHPVTWELEGCCFVSEGYISLAFVKMPVGGQATFSAWGAVWRAEALLYLYTWEASLWITELKYWTFGKSSVSAVTGTLLWSIWEAQFDAFLHGAAHCHCTVYLLVAGRIKALHWITSLICINTSPLGDHKRQINCKSKYQNERKIMNTLLWLLILIVIYNWFFKFPLHLPSPQGYSSLVAPAQESS